MTDQATPDETTDTEAPVVADQQAGVAEASAAVDDDQQLSGVKPAPLDDQPAPTPESPGPALSPEAAPEATTAERPLSFFQRRIWTRTGKAITIVVSAVSFATGIIGVMPILLRDATGLGSLEVSAAPFEAGPQEFALSPGADLTSFPVGGACDSEQLAWLASNAKPLAHRVAVDMGNRASEGSMLALTEFRAVTSAATGDVRIRVVCETPTPDVQSARLFVDQPAATAYFGGDTLGGDGRPDSPVAWNLAPGENGTIVIDLLSATAVTGTLQLTAQSGKDSTPIDVEGSDFALPGLVASGARFLLVTADGFTCQAVDGTECSVEALLAG